MRFLLGLVICVALAAAVPDPDPQSGLFRGRKIGGGRPAIGSRNRAEEKPATTNTRASSATRPAAAAASPPSTAAPSRSAPIKQVDARCNENACSPGYSKFQNRCYKVYDALTPVDFATAQRKCQADGAILAADKTPQVHNFLKTLLKPYLSETVDSQYRRAFIGLMCQDKCESPTNWLYADGSQCSQNDFCDWQKTGSTNEWNALPSSLYGASIAAMLDDFPDTDYRQKLQPYPADHSLQYMICEKGDDSTDHLKPRQLAVNERLSNVAVEWQRPACNGDISSYILVLLGGTTSYDTEMKCDTAECSFLLKPEECNHCIHPNTDYTFSVAAVLADSQLGPAITVSKKIDVETCPNFETPIHTVSTCRGVSEVVHDGSCDIRITWSKGSMCEAVCELGYGFFEQPSPKYSCDNGGGWQPAGKAPECYEIVPVFSANLQFKISYKRASIEDLQHQFDGLVYKYNDIFCPYPEECGIGDLQIKSALDEAGDKVSEVIITIDTPVYNITDQSGFIDLVREAVHTVTEDNAFMTLIDYDNIALVLPVKNEREFKADPQLCCHTCPEGHAYRLGNCVRCPNPDCA
ncbi:uncharacterized protein LOC135195514 isoform X2 [Macrobrachium nipponense]|uniref:uncharacterized protein LOC135195514 isoform X2 n=1 Tax=Macrobrachium nipponense TaxID=159736 RepID=UPI0030C7B501